MFLDTKHSPFKFSKFCKQKSIFMFLKNSDLFKTIKNGGVKMSKIGEFYQSGDWKNEKHVPVINCGDQATADSPFEVTVSIGDEIAHPNTTEHHIRWIKLYFKPEGEKFIYELASFDFASHGESVKGANEGACYTEPFGTAKLKLKSSGQLIAASYCNIHGLWESSKEIKVS